MNRNIAKYRIIKFIFVKCVFNKTNVRFSNTCDVCLQGPHGGYMPQGQMMSAPQIVQPVMANQNQVA